MSDQPQQPTEGWAPTDPQAADEPGKKKAKRPRRTGWRRLIPTWRMVLGTFVLGLIVLAGLFFLGYSMVKIPPANALATKQSNVYLYADGSQLARDGEVNRENVSLPQISKDAQHAVLAAEDRDFYTESAIDPKAMLRAGWNTATGKGKQSGSTITQQYVKNYYLAQEQTVTRKARSSSSRSSWTAPSPRTRSSRATSTPATSAATPTASSPPPRPTTARTPSTSTRPTPPTSPRWSTRRASTTSSRTPRTRRQPRPAGTTSWTAWSRRAGWPSPSAPD